MTNVSSALVNGGKVELVESFDTDKIISKYSRENNIDVSRFFYGLDTINLYKCRTTGYRFYHPKTIIGDDLFYKDLATKRSNYYSRRWEHYEALKNLKTSDNILEIGSGFGSFLNLAIDNGFENVKGIELSQLAVEKCREIGLNVQCKLIENLNKDVKFDVICSFQVLEHVYDVDSFLTSAISILKPGGKLILGVPNNNPFLHVSDKYHTLNLPPHHAGLWSKKSVMSLSKIYPIEVAKIKFEPIDNSYSYFLNFHLQNNKNFLKRISLKLLNKISKKFAKKTISYLVSGRNILVVFNKKNN